MFGLPCMSASTIRRWRRADRSRPWRYRLWQHIHDPLTCLVRARPVLQVYAAAQTLLQASTWVVCVDEKTALQARAAEAAPRPAQPGHVAHQSPRYTRRGALHLLAGLRGADGQVCGQCAQRKRFVDFQHFLQTVIVPAAQRRGVHTVALILDTGSTHAPKRLERWLHEQAVTQNWGVTCQGYWLPQNAAWLDQLEIWFSSLQRKLLQPNHFTGTDALEQAILRFIAYGNQIAKPITWSYTIEKLERKLGTN